MLVLIQRHMFSIMQIKGGLRDLEICGQTHHLELGFILIVFIMQSINLSLEIFNFHVEAISCLQVLELSHLCS